MADTTPHQEEVAAQAEAAWAEWEDATHGPKDYENFETGFLAAKAEERERTARLVAKRDPEDEAMIVEACRLLSERTSDEEGHWEVTALLARVAEQGINLDG